MDQLTETQVENTEIWRSCSHATACRKAMWQELPSQPDRLPVVPSDLRLPAALIPDETEGILFALAQAVEQRDTETAGHCERLALIGVALGFAMGIELSGLLALYRGGYLHDVGKVGIPDSILFKPGRLTASEWVTMRSHTVRGEEICKHMKSLTPVLPIIRHHHEKWDGSGYPDGLAGDQIPVLARILQIADIYDALISARPYKPAFTPQQALATMQEETAKGWRDPKIVDVFANLHKDVIMKIAAYTADADRSLQSMRSSMAGLQQFLAFAGA